MYKRQDITIWDDNATAPVRDYETSKPDIAALADEPIIISIGSNEARKKVVERLPVDANYIVAIHPQAVLARTVSIDNGTVIMGGVAVSYTHLDVYKRQVSRCGNSR